MLTEASRVKSQEARGLLLSFALEREIFGTENCIELVPYPRRKASIIVGCPKYVIFILGRGCLATTAKLNLNTVAWNGQKFSCNHAYLPCLHYANIDTQS
jgi:hypothetical protein